jgi:hypothetical protein
VKKPVFLVTGSDLAPQALALLDEIRSGHVAGAGQDSFAVEPERKSVG